MCSVPALIVKNTFWSIVNEQEEEEAYWPIMRTLRRKARTADEAACFGGWRAHGAPAAETVRMRRAHSDEGRLTQPAGELPAAEERTEVHSSEGDGSPDGHVENLDKANLATEDLLKAVAESLTLGEEVPTDTVAEVCALAGQAVFQPLGSQVLLQLLDVVSTADARRMAQALRGQVFATARSTHAHVVLEKLLHCLASADVAFIAEEMAGCAVRAAANVHGHSLLCRLLEYTAEEPATAALVDELLADAGALCCHKFGHLVAMSILSNGLPQHRTLIASAWQTNNLQRFARHRFGSLVLEHVLAHGPIEQRDLLAAELTSQPGGVSSLACHCFGIYVMRSLAHTPNYGEIIRHTLKSNSKKIAKDKYGNRLLAELGLDGGAPSVISIASLIGAGA